MAAGPTATTMQSIRGGLGASVAVAAIGLAQTVEPARLLSGESAVTSSAGRPGGPGRSAERSCACHSLHNAGSIVTARSPPSPSQASGLSSSIASERHSCMLAWVDTGLASAHGRGEARLKDRIYFGRVPKVALGGVVGGGHRQGRRGRLRKAGRAPGFWQSAASVSDSHNHND